MEERIGVFICNCGNSLNNIDFPWLQEKVTSLRGVSCVNLSTALCLQDGLDSIFSSIGENNLDRIVIAGCSPQLKENVFTYAMKQAKIESVPFTWVNLREQCSWAHNVDVSKKALLMIQMAISEVELLKPATFSEVIINQSALIIGGGFTGLTIASELSKLGIQITLVEKESTLGGQYKNNEIFSPFVKGTLNSLVNEVMTDSNIEVLTSSEINYIKGTVGNFSTLISIDGKKNKQMSFGAIVVAVGQEGEPSSAPAIPGVITFSELLRLEQQKANLPKRIAFLLDTPVEYYRTGTLSALAGAVALRQKLASEVYIFAQSLKVDSQGTENLYHKARENGVTFIKFDENPVFANKNGQVQIDVRDALLQDDVTVYCDLLVVEEKMYSSPILASTLEIMTDKSGFYQVVNPHLSTTLSERKGILLAGSCRADVDLARSLLESKEAALRVYELLRQKTIKVSAEVHVDPDKCRACLTCVRVCPHNAIEMEQISGKEIARIYELACEACGVCAALCPAKAIDYNGYSDDQILAQLKVIGVA